MHGTTNARDDRNDRRWSVLAVAAIVLGIALVAITAQHATAGRRLPGLIAVVLSASAVALVARRRPGRLAGLAAVGLGVAGTAAGAGVAIPHLADRAGAAATATGLVALGAGVALLIGGALAIGHGLRTWPHVLVTAVSLAAAAPTAFALAIAVAAITVPPSRLGAAAPTDLGLTHRDVEFAATDGVTLSGWYLPGSNGVGIVLLHGAGSNRSAVLDHAVVLARHGYGVLLFDARGHGRSDGQAMDFGWYGDQDVGGAVDYLAGQPEVEVIAAVGVSMGGEEAIGAAAADRRIRAVVAEGATARTAADKAWLPEQYGVRGWLQRPLDWLTFGATDLLIDAGPPVSLRDAARLAGVPTLLITAGDVADEAHAARFIADGSPDTVSIWQVPGSDHAAALCTAPAAWERRVTTFLGEALGLPSAQPLVEPGRGPLAE